MGNTKAAMLESAAIVDDFRSQCFCGFMAVRAGHASNSPDVDGDRH